MEKKIHEGHRQRVKSRYIAEGLDHFQDHEVLELLLFYCIPMKDTNELAHNMLREFGSLAAILEADPKDISRRCGLSAFEVISAMAGGIRHVHISDSNKSSDCIVPGRGELDYKLIFNKLMETGFDGDVIIELYRNNYNDISDLVKGCIFLQNLDYKKFNKKT